MVAIETAAEVDLLPRRCDSRLILSLTCRPEAKLSRKEQKAEISRTRALPLAASESRRLSFTHTRLSRTQTRTLVPMGHLLLAGKGKNG